MKKTNDERLLDSLDYIDEKFISRAEKYYSSKPAANLARDRFAKRNRILKIAVAVAACLVLLAVAIPTVGVVMNNLEEDPAGSLVIEHSGYTPPTDVRADDTNSEIETPPEHDGSKGLIYEINEDGKSVTWISFGSCTDEEVRIASHYNGLPVVAMELKAYWEAVRQPDGIHINIKENYFVYGSKYAKSLIIPDTIEKFDFTVVEKCQNLESIYIGAGITHKLCWLLSTGEGENINKIEISPDNPKYMSVNNCIIEKATKTLVRGCKTSIIPDDGSVEIIGNNAFEGVTGLKNITIPDCIKVIDSHAFAMCIDLESIVLPAGLERMEFFAFEGCQKLISVDLSGLEVIPMNAFYSCSKLAEVKGIEKVTEIGEGAFSFCRSLENFTLGKGLKKIGEHGLAHSVGSINYEGTVEEWKAVEKGAIWNGFSTASYLSKVICSDGVVTESSMTQQEYRESKNQNQE